MSAPLPVKVCGITRLEDAERAVDLGAWAIGFIFYPKSPRYVRPEDAREILARVPRTLATVGVFVDAPLAEVWQVSAESGVTWVQLHGSESPALCQKAGPKVIKAFRPRSEEDLARAADYSGMVTYLIDAAVEGQFGGTGHLSNWELARSLKQHGPLLLSGGLNALNVAEAIRSVAPWGVDVSSGVESAPGIKDPDKLAAFFRAVHEAA